MDVRDSVEHDICFSWVFFQDPTEKHGGQETQHRDWLLRSKICPKKGRIQGEPCDPGPQTPMGKLIYPVLLASGAVS